VSLSSKQCSSRAVCPSRKWGEGEEEEEEEEEEEKGEACIIKGAHLEGWMMRGSHMLA
jgi:hypothetical protein